MTDDPATLRPASAATEPSMETLAVHGGEVVDEPAGSVVFPIYQGTVYRIPPDTPYHDLPYLRLSSTPSQRYLHAKLAALEGGAAAVATASGMAAITTTLLAFLQAGDHLILADTLYGGTLDFVEQHAARLGWTYTFVDPTAPPTWPAALTPATRVFYVETITNPLMRVPALADVVAFCRAHDLVSVVDNTFATPVNFRPLALGFDICCHSATKYLSGHSDLVAGAVMGSAERVERVRHLLDLLGGSLDPHAGFLLARGIKTLALRMAAHNANALAIATFLARHPAVATVSYPGLPDHPDHARAAELLRGFGGMLSFRLTGGVDAVERMFDRLTIPAVAPSLGGVETLVTLPARTSHAGLSPADRARLGVTDDLVRLSVGVENPDDLVTDLDRALAGVRT